jgi:hypothetical protein
MIKLRGIHLLKISQKGFGHIEFMVALVVVLTVAAIGIKVLSTTHAQSSTSAIGNTCTRSAIEVPSCGVLWGAYVPDQQLPSLESQVGRQFDVFQQYNDFSTGTNGEIPNANDLSLIKGGRTLLATWQPRVFSNGTNYSWTQIANGSLDNSIIIPQAQRIKALGSIKIFLAFDSEMDDTSTHSMAKYGTPAEYVAAYQHIYNVFKAQGVTNVIWVWTPTGYSGYYSTLSQYYPGDTYVNWIGYDPYNFYECSSSETTWRSPTTLFSGFYNWVGNGGLGTDAASKPMILDEYGSHNDSNDPINGDSDWYAQIPAALQALPRLKALSEFDSVGICTTQLTSAQDVAGFKAAGLSTTVLGTGASSQPIPDRVAPIVSLKTPSNGTSVKGSVVVTASASDNVSVTKVEILINGIVVDTVAAAPYSYTWNTTAEANNSYTLVAKAFDAAGNVGTSSIVNVSVNNNSSSSSDAIIGIDNKCLDNANNVKANYNKIQLYSCNGSAEQQWNVEANGTIVNANGYCLNVVESGTASKTLVDLHECDGVVGQQWKTNNATNTIINPHSELCLDDQYANITNGNQIWVYSCNGTNAQVWHI